MKKVSFAGAAALMLVASVALADTSDNVAFCQQAFACPNANGIGACVTFFGASDRAAEKNARYAESCPAYADPIVLGQCAANLPSTKDFCRCVADAGDCALGGCIAARAAEAQAQRHLPRFQCRCLGICP